MDIYCMFFGTRAQGICFSVGKTMHVWHNEYCTHVNIIMDWIITNQLLVANSVADAVALVYL